MGSESLNLSCSAHAHDVALHMDAQCSYGRCAPSGATAVPVKLSVSGADSLMPMPSGKMQESGPFAKAMAAEVRATIARQRLTVKELAHKSGLSESYLGKRLRDVAPLTLNDMEAICIALGEDLLAFAAAALEAARDSVGE